MVMAKSIFDFLRHCAETDESKIFFILMIIAIAMMFDFVTGSVAAWVNPDIEFKSKAGINGILRKLASMLLLVIFIPISVLIPGKVGLGFVYTLYIGYLLMELKSIVENVGKNGTDTTLFTHILNKMNGTLTINDDKESGK